MRGTLCTADCFLIKKPAVKKWYTDVIIGDQHWLVHRVLWIQCSTTWYFWLKGKILAVLTGNVLKKEIILLRSKSMPTSPDHRHYLRVCISCTIRHKLGIFLFIPFQRRGKNTFFCFYPKSRLNWTLLTACNFWWCLYWNRFLDCFCFLYFWFKISWNHVKVTSMA